VSALREERDVLKEEVKARDEAIRELRCLMGLAHFSDDYGKDLESVRKHILDKLLHDRYQLERPPTVPKRQV